MYNKDILQYSGSNLRNVYLFCIKNHCIDFFPNLRQNNYLISIFFIDTEPLDLSCHSKGSNVVEQDHNEIVNDDENDDLNNRPISNSSILNNTHQLGITNEPLLPPATSTHVVHKRRASTFLRQKGQSYTRANGSRCAEIKLDDLKCKCQFDCENLNLNTRKIIFDHFWLLGNWDAQTAFICSTVKQVI